ncbi:uncharacterized protein LOC110447780 [Mizuhopecten yessoensis]|uniref:Olfactomedin-like domain-containing protein n=1 Tax=Mizuhopecten yessoensis TaxID=6573 RepID=A0A210QUK8_MIZYE|nr:uncharacterized protein LOC110447780 [Mizuhopecten yessoensis]XP_021349362.1 uncharacterized protein LOC110447780 [Mizuhopecten yessoensis]OWF52425.1 hypothetical protein KP79_PYT22162 [Mizuhopecten yessoensis]
MANIVVSCVFLFLLLAIFVNCDVDDITTSRHLRLIHVEIDMLTSLLTKKELARRQLQHCVTSLETRVNDSVRLIQNEEINIRKLRSTLHELKVLTEKERELYQNITEKMRALFPHRVLLRGPRNTAEMLVELDNILSRFTDVFAEPEMDEVSAECGPGPCFEPVTPAPQLQTTLDLCANHQDCEVSSFAVTENNDVIGLLDGSVVLFSGQDGSQLASYSFDFTPERMTYQDHETFYVEHTPRNDREIYRYNATSRQLTLLTSISDGVSTYGMEYLDGMLFIGGKYGRGMFVFLLGQSRMVNIFTYITNIDQYHSVYICPTELGSKYALFTGRIVRNDMILITSSGERICSIPTSYEYTIHCGVVSRDGTFYLPGHGEIVRYNNRCEPTGAFSLPDADRRISRIDLQNGKLYVHQYNGPFSIYQI